MSSDICIIVAVDFGTTYSGVAFCSTSSSTQGEIELVNTWPGRREVVNKVPSRLAYAAENKGLKSNRWGFSVTSKLNSYCWMKLLLDSSSKLSDFDDPALNDMYGAGMMRTPTDKSPEELCTDYLACLHEFVEEILVKRFSRGIYESTPIKYKVTVPAIWSDAAKAATRAAVIEAGFGARRSDSVDLISEPEAAAVAALKPHVGKDVLDPVKAGDNILVCDCGGGTVDITAYSILEIDPRLKFEELCYGTGGKCGSTYIDRNFNAWMSTTFGNAYTSIHVKKRGPGSQIMQNFETAKMAFGSHRGVDDEQIFEIENVDMNILDNNLKVECYDVEEQTLKLTWKDMQSFFDPVVNQVIGLVESQIDLAADKGRKIGRIILVGGFGDSEYLNEKMVAWCRIKGGIKLTCPPQCQAAVVRGAAIQGLHGIKPKSRISRRHYGYKVSRAFEEGVHDEWRHFYNKFDGTKRCNGLFVWVVRKGQTVDASTTAAYEMEKNVPDTSRGCSTSLSLYCCDHDDQPRYSDDIRVKKIGTIAVSFTDADVDEAPRTLNRKKRMWYRTIDYTVEFDFAIDQGTLEFRTMVNGRRAGQATIKFQDT